jgi:arylsulfatase A-like enzyme
MKRIVAFAAAAVAVAVAGWAVLHRGEPRPNVLLISIDTLRQDHVSAYGYDRRTTPTLDSLAVEGALCESAWTPTSWTLPAHVSAFTGLSPSAHQVEGGRDRLAADVVTLTQILDRAGYATTGFASHDYLDETYGFARGFDLYVNRPEQSAEAVSDQAVAWLEAHHEEPFFLFLHYFDPHVDYAPPGDYARAFGSDDAGRSFGEYGFVQQFEDPRTPLPDDVARRIVALYDGEILYTDAQITRVIDTLRRQRRLDDTIVAVFSDHGEEFKEHGSFGHGATLYAEVTRIPLIFRYPQRIPARTRVRSPLSLTDLPALIALLAGLDADGPASHEASASALLEEIAGRGAAPIERRLIFETTRDGPKRFATLNGGYSYIWPGGYARPADPASTSPEHGLDWIAVPEALFEMDDDPEQGVNLLDGSGSNASAGAIAAADAERSAVQRYLLEQVRGLRLVCASGGGGPSRFEGTVQFEAVVSDEPLGYNLGPGDEVVPLESGVTVLRSRLYGVQLTPGAGDKGILFPRPHRGARARIALLRDGVRLFDGVTEIPRPGETVLLGERDVGGGGCRIEGGVVPLEGERAEVTLSEEQIERLKSLGYVD